MAVFPVALPAVACLYNWCCVFGPASQPSQLNALHELTFLCTINRWHCILLSQQDVHSLCWAHGWRRVFHTQQAKEAAGKAWQAFLALLQPVRGKETPLKNVTTRQCGSLNAFSGRGKTQQPVMLRSKVGEHIVNFLFFKEPGRSHCSQRYNGWTWPSCLKPALIELGHSCCALNVCVFTLCVETHFVKHCKLFPVKLLLSASLFFGEQWCICEKCLSFRACQEAMLALNRLLPLHS